MQRALLPSDIPQLLAIERAVYPLPWTAAAFCTCLNIGALGWAVERVHQVVGFVITTCPDETCHILNIAVLPTYQRKGIGSTLLTQALEYAIAHHATVAHLEVRTDNTSAILFYQQAGFYQAGVRKNYYPLPDGNTQDALLFSKNL